MKKNILPLLLLFTFTFGLQSVYAQENERETGTDRTFSVEDQERRLLLEEQIQSSIQSGLSVDRPVASSSQETRSTQEQILSNTPLDLPFFDGFEDGLDAWTVEDRDGDGESWTAFALNARTGDFSASVRWNTQGNDDWLISPLLAIPAESTPTVSFWARSYDNTWLESFNVVVISEDGETTTQIASEVDIPAEYNEYVYDLSDFRGENIKIAIVCVSVDQFRLFVDDFLVTADDDGNGDPADPVVPDDPEDAIASTTAGGVWNSTDTWEDGVVPTEDDNVIIRGPVQISMTAACNDLKIDSGGLLENASDSWRSLIVHGVLNNEGIIRNNPDNWFLNISTKGDIYYSGSMEFNELLLDGTGEQTLYQTGSEPLRLTNFKLTDNVDVVTAGTALTFDGTDINLNDALLQLDGDLTMKNDALIKLGFIDGKDNSLIGEEPARLGVALNLRDIVLDGTLDVDAGSVTLGNGVVNRGILQNGTQDWRELQVSGDLVNEGTLRNNPEAWFLNIHAHEDIINSGIFEVASLRLEGGVNHTHTFLQHGTEPFTINNLLTASDSGTLVIGNEVSFKLANISLGGWTIILEDRLNLTENSLIAYATIEGNDNIIYGESGSGFSLETTVRNTNLQGTVDIASNSTTFAEGVINNGTLQNATSDWRELQITALFVNEGTVRNNPEQWFLNIRTSADLQNNGFWENNRTYMDGEEDQNLVLVNSNDLGEQFFFRSELDTGGPWEWKKDGDVISGATSRELSFDEGITTDDIGVYTSESGGQTGRNIRVQLFDPDGVTTPTVMTGTVSDITGQSAIVNGNVMDDGGATVTAYGMVWHTSENPDLDIHTGFSDEGSGTGEFVSNITELTPETTYYIRAYATNSEGTAYGNQVTFTTLDEVDDPEFAGGDGSEENPYLVATAGHLNNVRNHLDAHFLQIEDIALNAEPWFFDSGWEPIGYFVSGDNYAAFTGVYDGNGHVINGMYINRPNDSYIGLFALTHEAVLKNITLTNINVSAQTWAGGLVGWNGYPETSMVVNCHVEGEITATSGGVGGLIGITKKSRIESSSFNGEVTGALAGSGSWTGGLVGSAEVDTIANSYADATVTGFYRTGGLVGEITRHFSDLSHYPVIESSYARGLVYSERDGGGLVGGGITEINNSYSFVDVRRLTGSTDNNFAGFMGDASLSRINNSYSTGMVIYENAESPDNRGFVFTGNPTITSSYFDKDRSGQVSSAGGVEGKTSLEMKDQSTFEDWDFAETWAIDGINNNGYPYLRWEVTEEVVDGVPTVATAAVTDITANTAISGGDVTDEGDATVTARGIVWNTTMNPSLDNYLGQTTDGEGTGEFTSTLTDLSAETTYYVRAYATNIEGTAYGDEKSFTTIEEDIRETIADADGNQYPIVTLGEQTWMAENLKTTLFRDGTEIPLVTEASEWEETSNAAMSWYENDESNKAAYGALYNFYAVENALTCPGGWRIPSDEDWKILEMHLGMTREQADATDWRGTDQGQQLVEGEFDAVYGGIRWSSGSYDYLDRFGVYWSSSPNGYYRYLDSQRLNINRIADGNTRWGHSIRCIQGVEPPVVITSDISYVTYNSAQAGGRLMQNGGEVVTAMGVVWNTSENPTLEENEGITSVEDIGTGIFASEITDLDPATIYYLRAFATNSEGTAYGDEISFTTLEEGTVADGNGNIYNVIQIGGQNWITENLRATHLNDGTSIEEVVQTNSWRFTSLPAYTWLDNEADNSETGMGALYNWLTVDTGLLCPVGWEVPAKEDWENLLDYLGDGSAGKLRTISGWGEYNGTDDYGFSAIQSGWRSGASGNFGDFGANWWSATEATDDEAYSWYMWPSHSSLRSDAVDKLDGRAVRCVQEADYEPTSAEYLGITSFELHGNYPNPFNPGTSILFDIPEAGDVSVEIFNIMGQRMAVMKQGNTQAGRHTVQVDAGHWASGVYLYVIRYNNQIVTGKMTLVK